MIQTYFSVVSDLLGEQAVKCFDIFLAKNRNHETMESAGIYGKITLLCR